jgi:hypothetical protein
VVLFFEVDGISLKVKNGYIPKFLKGLRGVPGGNRPGVTIAALKKLHAIKSKIYKLYESDKTPRVTLRTLET